MDAKIWENNYPFSISGDNFEICIEHTVHLKNYEPLKIKIILKLIQYHLNIMGQLSRATMWKIIALSTSGICQR